MAYTSVGKIINVIGIDDCKFTPNGGSETDIYGIQNMKIDLQGYDSLSEGDGTVIDYVSKVSFAKATFSEVVLPLDSLAVLLGQTVEASGADPNFTQTLEIKDDVCPFGVLKGKGKIATTLDESSTVAPGAQVIFEIKKFRLDPNSLSINAAMKNAVSIDFGGTCVAVDKVIISIKVEQTAT